MHVLIPIQTLGAMINMHTDQNLMYVTYYFKPWILRRIAKALEANGCGEGDGAYFTSVTHVILLRL